jgi:hypothetical protein
MHSKSIPPPETPANLRFKNSELLLICKHCGCEFRRPPSQQRPFCSQTCYALSRRTDPIPRFWERVDKTPGHGPNGDCWVWTGANVAGYGVITVNGAPVRATRFSYGLHNGPVPEGLVMCHTCDNPPCVRPDHLFAGTYSQNTQDALSKGRIQRRIVAWPANPFAFRGERNGRAKLSENEIEAIRQRYAAGGVSQQVIADEYGVTQNLISKIILRQLWSHIDT